MNAIDQERVVEILVPNAPNLGTGYLLGDGCVLTAYHVIQDYGDEGIKCRPLGNYNRGRKEWFVAKAPIWVNSELDLALVEVPPNPAARIPWLTVKKLSLNRRLDCQAYGFPKFRKQELEGKSTYDAYVVEGWIKPLLAKNAGELLIEIEGATPRQGMKGWQGISGSALFTEEASCFVGVVLKGPDELGGNQLKAIALAHVIESDPSFNQRLETHFHQSLNCLNEAADVAAAYGIHLTLKTLELRKTLSQIEAAEIDREIKRCERQQENQPRWANTASEWSMLPEKQLQDLLVNIAASDGDIFWSVWHHSASSVVTRTDLDIEEVYLLLRGSMDRSRLDSFLIALYHQLEQANRQAFLGQLAALAQAVRQVDITQTSVLPENAPQPAIANPEQGCLLIKLESLGRPEVFPSQYAVSMWLVENRQAYQSRFRAAGTAISEASKATPLFEAEPITVKTAATQAEDLKQQIAERIAQVWTGKGQTPLQEALAQFKISKLKPAIAFFVPVHLLEVDFHNIEFGRRGEILGLALPVSVSCLDRYVSDDEELKDFWIERWQVLETFGADTTLSLLEAHEDDLDVTCSKKLWRWLLRKDNAKEAERKAAGLWFRSPCHDLTKIFMNFVMNGLPLVFWPSRGLDDVEVSQLQVCLNADPADILPAIKSYRIDGASEDAGPVAVLLDNPYLCPPDCNFDFQ